MVRFKTLLESLDIPLLVTVYILQALGIAVLYSFSFGGDNRLWFDQLIYVIAGSGVIGLLAFYDYRSAKNYSVIAYIITVLTLVAVYFWGAEVFGAKRWISIGTFRFQPSEMYKFVEIVFFARVFSKWEEKNWSSFIYILILAAVPILLVIIQPDLGTSILLSIIFIFMLISVRLDIKKWLVVIGLVALTLPFIWFNLADYQKTRITTFLNPMSDPTGSGYNIAQSRIAIGSGSIFGQGLGRGSQSQLNFLPVAHTDFIFAAIAEAIGFVGSMLVIILLGFLSYRAFMIAELSQDSFGSFFALGASGLLLISAIVNIAGNLGLAPITGIPLPFISFGGTATISQFAIIGLLQSIYLRHKKMKF